MESEREEDLCSSSPAKAITVLAPVTPDLTQPKPQPQRSRGLFPKSVYLFYDHYPMSKWTHSLYKIDIDTKGTSEAQPEEVPTPVAQFPDNGENPSGMRCARLESKVYILGGVVTKRRDEGAFPRDVYVFDMNSGELEKLPASLNTGKPCPCVFAANGKVYALGSIHCLNMPLLDMSRLLSSIELFECFDPKLNKWEVLNNPPPVDRRIDWMGCTVLEKRQQVVVLGWEPSKGDTVRLVYDLNHGTWTRDLSHSKIAINFQEGGDGDALYGLRIRGAPFKSKLGEFMSIKDERALNDGRSWGDDLIEMSTHEPRNQWLGIFTRQPYVECDTRLLRYVGSGHFFYILSGSPCHPNGPDRWGNLPPDQCTRGVTITVFKEIDEGNVECDDGNHVIKGRGGNPKEPFKTKILHSQEFVMRTPFYSMAELVGCFIR